MVVSKTLTRTFHTEETRNEQINNYIGPLTMQLEGLSRLIQQGMTQAHPMKLPPTVSTSTIFATTGTSSDNAASFLASFLASFTSSTGCFPQKNFFCQLPPPPLISPPSHTIIDIRNIKRRNVSTHARVNFSQSATSSLLRGGGGGLKLSLLLVGGGG